MQTQLTVTFINQDRIIIEKRQFAVEDIIEVSVIKLRGIVYTYMPRNTPYADVVFQSGGTMLELDK